MIIAFSSADEKLLKAMLDAQKTSARTGRLIEAAERDIALADRVKARYAADQGSEPESMDD